MARPRRPSGVHVSHGAPRALRSLGAAGVFGVLSLSGCTAEVALPPGLDALEAPIVIPEGFESPAPLPRAARLTRSQWENTVRDLLRLDDVTGFSSELPQDALPAGFLFENAADTLAIDQSQWEGFARAAARAAEFVVADSTRLQRLLPAAALDEGRSLDDRAAAVVDAIAPRAHRRPIDDVDRDAYLALFRVGQTAFAEHTSEPFVGGVRLFLEGVLQSPSFLYRLELQGPAPGQALVRLDGYALANRLSYALWNTMPDDALFADAAAGAFDDDAGYADVVARVVNDERATGHVVEVFEAIFEAEKLEGVSPDQDLFGDVPVDLGALALEENRLFLRELIEGGAYADVLTSTDTFVNADLARVYGVDGAFGDAFEKVSLDPASRKGLFTHVGFLSQFATRSDPDPIHRGVFLAKNIVCHPLSAPPDNIPPLPAAENQESNRQVVERHTEQPNTSCQACHSTYINPLGFPYENFDAVGRVRADDRGLPINTATAPLLDGVHVPVDDAVALADALRESPQVHACLAQHLIESSLGRRFHPEDDPWVARLGAQSLDGESLRAMLIELLTSPGFRLRSTTELQSTETP